MRLVRDAQVTWGSPDYGGDTGQMEAQILRVTLGGDPA